VEKNFNRLAQRLDIVKIPAVKVLTEKGKKIMFQVEAKVSCDYPKCKKHLILYGLKGVGISANQIVESARANGWSMSQTGTKIRWASKCPEHKKVLLRERAFGELSIK